MTQIDLAYIQIGLMILTLIAVSVAIVSWIDYCKLKKQAKADAVARQEAQHRARHNSSNDFALLAKKYEFESIIKEVKNID